MLLKIANSYSKAATQCLTVYVGQSGKDKVKTTNKNSIVGELVKKYSASGEFKAGLDETLMLRAAGLENFQNVMLVGIGNTKNYRKKYFVEQLLMPIVLCALRNKRLL